MKISVNSKGDWSKTFSFLNRAKQVDYAKILQRYGDQGLRALAQATPKDTGNTAESWTYEVEVTKRSSRLIFKNTNVVRGIPVVILLQYGHGVQNGGYVQGVDFINPAIQPIFDKIANDAWREVTK